MIKYQKSSSYKKYKREYNKGDVAKKSRERYESSEKGKQMIKKYHNSDKWKQAMNKVLAKRQRDLGWIPLFDNPFPEDVNVHYHHINNILVIPMPSITHMNNLGMNHREQCNMWINKLFGFVGV